MYIDKHTEIQKYGVTDRCTVRYINKKNGQTDRQLDRQTNRQKCRQTEKQGQIGFNRKKNQAFKYPIPFFQII